ncbi:MAG: hypothetical protein M3R38_01825 [Actinomycetota bacterium]|nr:hypothetical protein [Actinomycetota bacterium]
MTVNEERDRRRMARALRPHVSFGMELRGVGERDGKPTVVLESKRRYDGERFSWEVSVKPEEVAKNAKRVARMLSMEAAEDLRRAFPERRNA